MATIVKAALATEILCSLPCQYLIQKAERIRVLHWGRKKLNSVNTNCAVQAENDFWPILIRLMSVVIGKHEKAKSNFVVHLAHLHPLFLCLCFFC